MKDLHSIMPIKKIPSGTKEWADSNINISFGCENNCRYCYAKKMAIRFKRKSEENWINTILNQSAIDKKYSKRNGRIMFPSTHDITPFILPSALIVLKKILASGNIVLITSKPRFECIKTICDQLREYQSQIQFRFTIGSNNNDLLRFWEPNAPNFQERISALKYAYDAGYKTSISIEPFLDFDPLNLINDIYSYVTESIWIGRMNYIPTKNISEKDKIHYIEIRKNYTIQNIKKIYEKLKDNPKIQWKDSIKKILHLF